MKATDEENVKVLSRAVLSDARGDAAQLRSEARAKADEIRKHAQEEADAIRAQILEQAKVEAERVRSQAIATTQLKVRTMQLEQREKLLENVFETARQQLSAVQKSRDYEKTAVLLLREALTQLGAKTARVRADKTTEKIFTSALLEKISKELGVGIQVGDALEQGMGVVVETEDGRRQYDNTLETRLKRMQNALRSSVYRILTGETI